MSCDIEPGDPIFCNFLKISNDSLPDFKIGDRVILTLPEYPGDRGCILGTIAKYSDNKSSKKKENYLFSRKYPIKNKEMLSIEDEVIKISAKKGPVIECGKGTITFTEDGKINIEGTRLVSRSKGVNKIRGAVIKMN